MVYMKRMPPSHTHTHQIQKSIDPSKPSLASQPGGVRRYCLQVNRRRNSPSAPRDDTTTHEHVGVDTHSLAWVHVI